MTAAPAPGSLDPPLGWRRVPLGGVLAAARLGGNYPSHTGETGRPLIKMGNIGRGGISLDKLAFVPGWAQTDPIHLLDRGDVLFNTRNTLDLVGKVAIWRGELPIAYYNSNLMRLEFDPRAVQSPEYACFALNSHASIAALRALATGTTSVAAIYTRDLMQFEMLVPPPPEQRAIAAALSDVDALIASLDQLIAKKRDIKQGVMQQLLTGKTRLPGFSGDWPIASAGELGRFRGGSGFAPDAQGESVGELPFFKVSDMNLTGNEIEMRRSNNWVSAKTSERLGATVFPAGSIVIAKVGAAVFLERKRILAVPSCIDNNMAAFVLDPRRLCPRFAHLAMLNVQLGALVATTALPSLNGRALAGIQLPAPSLAEQEAIAQILTDLDTELTLLTARRDKTRLLKQGMMQELLTGKTRLV